MARNLRALAEACHHYNFRSSKKTQRCVMQQTFQPSPDPTKLSMSSEQDIYEEHVLDHYEDPYHRGDLEKATHSHEADNPLCGDVVHIDLRIDGDEKIQEAWFATLGGTLRTDDYDQAVEIAGVSVDREDDTLSAKFRLTYVPPESFLQVFVEGQVRDRESNAPARDFSQNVASAGVSLTY